MQTLMLTLILMLVVILADELQILSWNGSDYAWVSDQVGVTTANINADTLNVSGVSTFAGITTVTGQTLFSKQLSISGISSIGGNIIVGHTTPGSGSIISWSD